MYMYMYMYVHVCTCMYMYVHVHITYNKKMISYILNYSQNISVGHVTKPVLYHIEILTED